MCLNGVNRSTLYRLFKDVHNLVKDHYTNPGENGGTVLNNNVLHSNIEKHRHVYFFKVRDAYSGDNSAITTNTKQIMQYRICF